MTIIDNLEAMIAAGKDNALLRYSLGREYLKREQPAQALEHLQQAVVLDPTYSAAWKALGSAFALCGQEGEAIRAYSTGIENAEKKGDIQAAKEMKVFRKRLEASVAGQGRV